jgi:hypothetical protein
MPRYRFYSTRHALIRRANAADATAIYLDRDLSAPRVSRTMHDMKETALARKCPVAPPSHRSVQARALHRACVIVGGVKPLAQRLDLPAALLERWMRGEAPPPEHVFHAAVEIILLHAAGTGQAN